MYRFILGLSFLILANSPAIANKKPLDYLVENTKKNGDFFQPIDILKPESNPALRRELADLVASPTFLTLDAQVLQSVIKNKPEYISIFLKTEDSTVPMVLDLIRHEVLTDDFVLNTDKGRQLPTTELAAHYRGTVRYAENSLVAFSFIEGEIMAILATPEIGNMTLGKMSNSNTHIFYRQSDWKVQLNAECHTQDTPASHLDPANLLDEPLFSEQSTNCVRLYLECDHDLYLNKGSLTATQNYVTGLFNQVSILYQNEIIPIAISEIFVWTTPSVYSGSSSLNYLNGFANFRTSFNGNLAHLLHLTGNMGGIAWLDVICSSSNRYAFSDLSGSFSSVPTYSWDANVVTHEMGHNLGSQHTHACAWNNNNTAIDACGPTYGASFNPPITYEGNCSNALIPTSGGTIMSYCHLGNAGINFSNGFGTQPGNRVRSRVDNATCLTTCTTGGGGTTATVPTDINASDGTSTTQVTVSWTGTSGQFFQVYRNTSNSTIGMTALSSWQSSTTYNDASAVAGTTYYYAVKAALTSAGGSPSAFSAINSGFRATASTVYCTGIQTFNTTTGTISDGSGTNQYGNNTDCYKQISVTGATSISISFTAFATETSYDFVRVYGGTTTSATLLGTYSGSTIPATINVNGANALIRFTSDVSVTAAGWSLNYTATVPPPTPANDEPCNATLLTAGSSCVSTQGNNTNATLSASPSSVSTSCTGVAATITKDLWYKYVLPPNAQWTVRLAAGTMTDAVMSVYYANTTCSSLVEFGCEDDNTDGNGSLMPVIYTNNPSTGNYTIYVRVWNYSGTPTGTFNICALNYSTANKADEMVVGKNNLLEVFPNPVNNGSWLRINYTLEESSDMELALYDLSGKTVSVVEQTYLEAGKHSSEITTNGLSEGVYFLRLRTPNSIQTSRIVVLK